MRRRRDQSRRREHLDAAAASPPELQETVKPAPSSAPAENAARSAGLPIPPYVSTKQAMPSSPKAMASVSTPPEHRSSSLEQNLKVHPQAPAADVLNIQSHPSLEGWISSCRHLPKSCNSRCYIQSRQMLNGISGKIIQRMRPWSYQTHFTFQHV